MKHEKLKEIVKKEKQFERPVQILGIVAVLVLMIGLANAIFFADPLIALVGTSVVIAFILAITIYIISCKASKYTEAVYDYICVKIMSIMVENGIDIDNFEMINEANTGILYIGFHNLKVNYEDLSSKLNCELDEMNKISGRNIKVKLI